MRICKHFTFRFRSYLPALSNNGTSKNNVEIELALVKLFEEDISLERKSDAIKSILILQLKK